MANIANAAAQAGMCYYLTADELSGLFLKESQNHWYICGLPDRMISEDVQSQAKFLPDTAIRDKDGNIVKDKDGSVQRWKEAEDKKGNLLVRIREVNADGKRVTNKVNKLEYAEAELDRKAAGTTGGSYLLQLEFKLCEGDFGPYLVCYFKEGKLKVSGKKLF